MDKINILIIEDTEAEAKLLSALLIANNYNIIAVANNFRSALEIFLNSKVDVVIVDIFINGVPDGIVFAETITVIPNALKPFVFLSSSKDRQIFERAKLTRPFSYLMKPFNELEILYAIEIAFEKFYNQVNVFSNEAQNTVVSEEYFFIKKSNSIKKLLISSVLYIEVEGRYCKIVTETETYLILMSLLKLSDLLDAKVFFKISRSTIVNSLKIIEIVLNDNLIILEGNHKVMLNDSYKEFIKKLTILK